MIIYYIDKNYNYQQEVFMDIKKITSGHIDSYLSKNNFFKINDGVNDTYTYIKDDKRKVKITKFDTDEYWAICYTSEEKLSNIVTMHTSELTKEEVYGFYMKIRHLNNGKYKFKPFINIDKEIESLGYILDANAYPHSLVYKKYDIDGVEVLRVIIYKDSEYNCHVLKAENTDNYPMELNERELRAFYKKMNRISKDWERDYRITQNLRERLLFE